MNRHKWSTHKAIPVSDLSPPFKCRLNALPGRLSVDSLDTILFKLASREQIKYYWPVEVGKALLSLTSQHH